jgi:O-acetyl-ADP-ribose deacetylase (regulator of RNase III)
MKIEYIAGDLLSSPERVIAHGCNAQGVMRSGVAKDIRAKYPQAFADYSKRYRLAWIDGSSKTPFFLSLGDVIETKLPDRTILNIISQKYYGRDSSVRYVSYDAITDAIKRINDLGYTRVAFPKIGAGLANGNWDVISTIIESYSDFAPIVYYIDPQAPA